MRAQETPCMWKDYIWNLATCSCQNGKYLATIMDDSGTTKKQKLFQQILMKREQHVKHKISILHLHFY